MFPRYKLNHIYDLWKTSVIKVILIQRLKRTSYNNMPSLLVHNDEIFLLQNFTKLPNI